MIISMHLSAKNAIMFFFVFFFCLTCSSVHVCVTTHAQCMCVHELLMHSYVVLSLFLFREGCVVISKSFFFFFFSCFVLCRVTNGGKTTLTNRLIKNLPNCCVVHQDDFFKVSLGLPFKVFWRWLAKKGMGPF